MFVCLLVCCCSYLCYYCCLRIWDGTYPLSRTTSRGCTRGCVWVWWGCELVVLVCPKGKSLGDSWVTLTVVGDTPSVWPPGQQDIGAAKNIWLCHCCQSYDQLFIKSFPLQGSTLLCVWVCVGMYACGGMRWDTHTYCSRKGLSTCTKLAKTSPRRCPYINNHTLAIILWKPNFCYL